jgi:glutamate synthase (NADPH) large chain
MVGRTDCLAPSPAIHHWKAACVDLSPLLANFAAQDSERSCQSSQDHELADSLDHKILLPACRSALTRGLPFQATLPIRNINRAAGTRLGSEITRRYGSYGLPDDTIQLKFVGSAGQSFGSFIPHGLTLLIEGEANDYIGKGLSGGKIIVRPDPRSNFKPEENIIIGNVAFYGATSGEAYVRGVAGERFCVRNSGARAVAEGAGDHGCEYMTGGRVVILGPVGRNFAAGMSGGIAYALDADGTFLSRCNMEMVEPLALEDPDEIAEVQEMVRKHVQWTGSQYAAGILAEWETYLPRFWKVMPYEYRQMLEAHAAAQKQGLHGDEALMAAFENNQKSAGKYKIMPEPPGAPAGIRQLSGEDHGKSDRLHRLQARTAI